MKKFDIGQSLSIVANVGVIAGIVFLAFELRQNNSLLAAQASYSRLSIANERRARLMENRGGLLEAMQKSNSGEALTPLESAQVELQAINVIDTWQWEYREYLAGRLRLEDMNLAAWRGQWEQDVSIRESIERRPNMPSDFVEFLQQAVSFQPSDPRP